MLKYFRWIFRYYRTHRLHTVFLALLTLISATVALAFPLVFRYLLDNVQEVLAPGSEDRFLKLLLALGAVGFARMVAGFYPGARAWLNSKIGMEVRDDAFVEILKKDYRFFSKFGPGDLSTRLTDDIVEYPRIAWFSCSGIFRAVESASRLVFCLGVMVFMSAELTLLSLVPLPIMLWIFYRTERKLGKRVEESRKATSSTSDLLDSTFAGIAIIKAYRAEKGQSGRLRRLLDSRLAIDLSITKLVMVIESLYSVLGEVGKVTVLFLGGLFVIRDRISIGDLYAFYVYLDMLLAPMIDIPNLFVTSKQAFASIDRVREVMDFPPAPERSGVRKLDSVDSVEFRNAGFRYPGCDAGVIGVTGRFESPMTVAVVGEVGSGKSTLVKMLSGQLPCTEGGILVNGIPLMEVDPSDLSLVTGYVPQESSLFSDSVGENVRLGRGMEDQTVERALALADLPAGDLPEGLETRLGQGGSGVSGGQKQRVAIARALAGDPGLCLFDDCTAALDADLEQRLWDGLRAEGGKRLIFVVTHREATVRQSDLVIFLHRGILNAIGTHEELLRTNEVYRLVLATEMS